MDGNQSLGEGIVFGLETIERMADIIKIRLQNTCSLEKNNGR